MNSHGAQERPGAVLAVLLVAPFLSQADATIANVATPEIGRELGASGAALELVIGGYLVTFAALLITGARLGEIYGFRRVFLTGLAVFGVASLACGLAPNPAVLVLARAVQGVGAALMFPQTLTGIQQNFLGDKRIRAVGAFAVALSAGAVLGQVFGGVLIAAGGWRLIFLVNVPITVIAVVAGARLLPADARTSAQRIDVPGVLALSAGVGFMLLPLTLGAEQGWPAWTWISLAACVAAILVFVAVERRAARGGGAALISGQFLAPRAVWAGLVNLTATSATYFALLFIVAQYFQFGLGHSALVSGMTLVPWVGAFGLAGQLVRRAPAALIAWAPVGGTVLLAGAFAALSGVSFAGNHAETVLVILLGVGGFGLGVQFSAMLTHVTNAVHTGHAADISGVSTTLQQIGAAVGVAASGTLYLGLVGDAAFSPTRAFAVVNAVFTGVALLAAVFAYLSTAPHSAEQIHVGSIRPDGSPARAGNHPGIE
ncbi:MFS transporter [Nocardia colli]|uniref:MFS transporter n=1 Tax=Nocardia colli TaxID=2545717 RepID=A0A5N0DV17_9NOCA|nr:MFS transporter [Nocardia colli]KAA8880593.1 MFS transporter [Nocardia colli]